MNSLLHFAHSTICLVIAFPPLWAFPTVSAQRQSVRSQQVETDFQSRWIEAVPLVFAHNPNRPVARHTIQRWKVELEGRSGMEFTMHRLRRTHGQNLLNRGVGIESVSIALGHNSTLTTERHYCRKNVDSARREIVRAFKQSIPPCVNSPLIEPERQLPGHA